MNPRPFALVLLALLVGGCVNDDGNGGILDPPPVSSPAPIGPPLVFGGVVVDALTNATLADARVRIDLAQAQPCGRQGVGWNSWVPPMANGTYGPLDLPRPRSDDVAFFLHATAAGYAENATFIGPAQAREGLSRMTVRLHPDASVNGTAPPGTVLALDAPTFPRVTVASANGTFEFPRARGVDAMLVAGTDVPFRTLVRAPETIDVPRAEASGWTLEGSARSESGAAVAADVVAWNGTSLVSVARSGPGGTFALPLPTQPATLRIEARTSDNHFGGSATLEVNGPPALRETILLKPLC